MKLQSVSIRKSVLGALPVLALFTMLSFLNACSSPNADQEKLENVQTTGKWIVEKDGSTMIDPQTSGLSYSSEGLYTISDGSAHLSQIQRLHQLDPQTGAITSRLGPIVLSERVASSCFAPYLLDRPDYEGVIALPNKDNAWLLVTEDSTRRGEISAECKAKYSDTNSTEEPTLLVKVELIEGELVASGVRALRFKPEHQLGDYPNDGIEGLTITRNNKILLGLEKDAKSRARVFEIDYSEELFSELDTFVTVKDTELALPKFSGGKHPINGMDVYYPSAESEGFLIAAARNDNQLWIIDLAKKRPTKQIVLEFFAPSTNHPECEPFHKMNNASLEGVATMGNTLLLVNDPWRSNYLKNVTCEADEAMYKRMSPLLFKIDMPASWFN